MFDAFQDDNFMHKLGACVHVTPAGGGRNIPTAHAALSAADGWLWLQAHRVNKRVNKRVNNGKSHYRLGCAWLCVNAVSFDSLG